MEIRELNEDDIREADKYLEAVKQARNAERRETTKNGGNKKK